jgi:hypothetical protein
MAVVYAGPKTWNQAWDQDGTYDSAGSRWVYNEMGPKSDDACSGSCESRVVFINTSGGWTYSYTDTFSWTITTIPPGSENYGKKPYCKNNSVYVYTAQCDAFTA